MHGINGYTSSIGYCRKLKHAVYSVYSPFPMFIDIPIPLLNLLLPGISLTGKACSNFKKNPDLAIKPLLSELNELTGLKQVKEEVNTFSRL
jgi:hypothetical protein